MNALFEHTRRIPADTGASRFSHGFNPMLSITGFDLLMENSDYPGLPVLT